ncbi:MAG: hypothetical protein LBI05_00890 [Planctomycetaceae bacterium]|jgi:hypothetical protein|nr:hypothetical protein [Planctomycetaceae bacterium]
MKIMPPPQIIVKGGKDLDGAWGTSKTFVREFVFELIRVPLPRFMLSPFIPAYNSLHPLYPFAIAKDSKLTKNIETNVGRAVTVQTTYQILKPAVPLNGLSGFDLNAVINGNFPPFILPAQDVSYEPVAVEEALDDLFVPKSDAEMLWEATHTGVPLPLINRWKQIPFRTSAGTKLTGTTSRNILKMSFWYFADPMWFDEAFAVTTYTGTVNAAPEMIAGRFCPPGTAKIESLEVVDNIWERQAAEPYSLKLVSAVFLLDNHTWCKRYENVSNLFMAYPYQWEDSDSGKEDTKLVFDPHTGQPQYTYTNNVSPQRIFCTMYDPEPENEGSESDPIYVQDPKNAIQFFGTREDCFRLNPDSEPTEVSEPMYLDGNGFILYPDPATGKVDTSLSPKVEGYVFPPMDFTPLHFPIR